MVVIMQYESEQIMQLFQKYVEDKVIGLGQLIINLRNIESQKVFMKVNKDNFIFWSF